MGVNTKAELTKIEEVLAFYDLHKGSPCFCVYAGVSCKPEQVAFDYLDTEQPEEGREVLEEFLRLIKSRSDNNNVYTIQLVDEWKEVDVKGGGGLKQKVYKGRSLRFQLNPNQAYFGGDYPKGNDIVIRNETSGSIPQSGNNEVVDLLKMMLAEAKAENERLRLVIEEKLDQREGLNYDDDDNDDDNGIVLTPQEKILGTIGGILEREEVQEGIAGLLLGGQKWFNRQILKNE